MILRGLYRLAIFDAKGIEEFGSRVDDFYASLAPLIALPLAEALAVSVSGHWREGALGFLALLDGALLLPVLIHLFAAAYGKEPNWLRTATAINWSFWMLLPAVVIGALLDAILTSAGFTGTGSTLAIFAAAALYLLAYRWFALRAGLGITGLRAFTILLAYGAASVVLDSVMIHAGIGIVG